jgi:hypothetical protein
VTLLSVRDVVITFLDMVEMVLVIFLAILPKKTFSEIIVNIILSVMTVSIIISEACVSITLSAMDVKVLKIKATKQLITFSEINVTLLYQEIQHSPFTLTVKKLK